MARKTKTQKNRKGNKKVVKKSGKKTKKNEFFKLMLDARKKVLPSFIYNNKTYKRKTGKGKRSHLVFYKA
tara:strand:- start:563 stop:772 length:210 start_codon:yes stop_codon:yes gene_type:complete